MLVPPDSRRMRQSPKNPEDFREPSLDFTCSAEVNSACAKILLPQNACDAGLPAVVLFRRPGLSPPGKTKSAQRLQLSLKLLDAGRLVAGRYDMDLDFLVAALAGQHHAVHAATWRILPRQLAAADGTDRPAVFYFDCITAWELFQCVSAPFCLIPL